MTARLQQSLEDVKDLPPLPSQYDFLANEVPVDEPAGLAIKALVNESLPNWGLVRVRRFANKALWAHYVTRRDSIGSGSDFGAGDASNPNVKLLWHGTREPVQILNLVSTQTLKDSTLAALPGASTALDATLHRARATRLRSIHGAPTKTAPSRSSSQRSHAEMWTTGRTPPSQRGGPG